MNLALRPALDAERGLGSIRLRVFEENPARALYSLLGFRTRAIVAGKVHLSFELPPDDSSPS